MKNLKYSGGDLIGSGSFGCVFHPAIKCKGQKNIDKDTVSKIFFSSESKQEALEEMKIDNIIRKIKGNTQWAHIWDKNCIPNKYSDIQENEPKIEQCIYDNRLSEYDFNKYRRMLQGTYAGVPMDHVFDDLFKKSVFKKKELFVKNFLQMMRLMKPLFIGLVEMHKNNISHNDIKFDNIMIDGDGCKFIDFGLAAKTDHLKFYKQRSMSEFVSDRIYPPYPYEFIYLFADNDVLQDELEDKEYDIYRDLHDRYQLVHESVFKRQKLKEYLIGLIDISKDGGLLKDKHEIISLIDTYSVGILIPYALVKMAKKYNQLNLFLNYVNSPKVNSFFDLFKSMSEPDFHNRMNPEDAYNRYLELDILYLSKKTNKKPIKRTNRRVR
tara:strand:- start:59 stop:1201 length:1143 start_codon:yes stop_codon:yes gene_type:complete